MSTDALSAGSDNNSFTEEYIPSLVCPKCNDKYPSIDELLKHQELKRHFVCDACNSSFWTQEGLHGHKRKDHRPVPDLECFGCGSHFTRAAHFWRHFEANECKVIYASDLVKLREKNLEFAKQLELRKLTMDDVLQCTESHITGENTWASESGAGAAHAEPVTAPSFPFRPAPISLINAHPLHYRSEDFPMLPATKSTVAVPSPPRAQNGNVWSNSSARVPRTSSKTTKSYNAVPPPVSYNRLPQARAPQNSIHNPTVNNKIRIIQPSMSPAEGGPHTTTSSGRVIDPDDDDYNPAVFYNSILEQFVCPYKSCGKKFVDAFKLTRHLRSPTHTGGRISCICCRKVFPTVAGLIGHMESATKCPIRETDGFRRALGQITGGILDFHIRSNMFVIDTNSVRELFNLHSESTRKEGEEIAPKFEVPYPKT
ncbi:putative c2h2 finger domain protein [Rosellinia necatrix]|uniref:Putative c2h2 finger domain protein n=1 Tax=Rosellinia necatrix TaxID=77044 RepID=A0A1W2TQ78_ROSNE|nr:putative c2h2 finger domain protein [Rosellinia necatrix]